MEFEDTDVDKIREMLLRCSSDAKTPVGKFEFNWLAETTGATARFLEALTEDDVDPAEIGLALASAHAYSMSLIIVLLAAGRKVPAAIVDEIAHNFRVFLEHKVALYNEQLAADVDRDRAN